MIHWDVAETSSGRPLNLGKASTAKVMQALLMCDGQLLDSHLDGDTTWKPRMRLVTYRIAIPAGQRKLFEIVSSCKLSVPEEVTGQ